MIIGLMGFIGTGKDTVSDILVQEYGFKKLSFADPVKDVVSSVFGWDRDLVEGDTAESRDFRNQVDEWWSKELGIEGFTPRMALQQIGTELFRDNFNQEIWIKNTLRRMQSYKDVVVTDVRFKNEAHSIVNNGGHLVRVTKGQKPNWFVDAMMASEGDEVAELYLKNSYSLMHRSEWDCLSIREEARIRNDGTLQDLKQNVRLVYQDLL